MKTLFIPLLAVSLLLSGCSETKTEKNTTESISKQSISKQTVPSISKESEDLFQKAVLLYGKGNQLDALQVAEDSIAKDPKNYKALSLKGIIEAFNISPEKGAETIHKALAINPDYTQGYYDLAMADKLGKKYDESIAHFQKVLEKDPKNTWSYYGIATNYADKKDKKNALIYLQKAIALDPSAVKPVAQVQDHFAWLHHDQEFLSLVQ